MITLLLALNCLPTQIINESNEPWNDKDQEVMERAANTCQERYEEIPCLKRFFKRAPQAYAAICGEEKNGDIRSK